jgi:hypothetical protein
MAILSDGKFKVVADCNATDDAELKPILEYEAKSKP